MLTAAYAGDTNFLASASAQVPQAVSSVDLSTKSLVFGNQIQFTTSAAQTVTLTNVGTAALVMSTIGISGDFSQTNNCPFGGTLRAGRSCSISVRFTPTATGVRTGTLTITDVDPSSPQVVLLTGTGVQPVAVLSPTSLNFGTIARRTSKTLVITLSNPGTAPLTITGITILGANQFTQTNNCGNAVGINGSCNINVTFSSNQTGTFNGTLNLSDNAPGSPQQASLTGIVQ